MHQKMLLERGFTHKEYCTLFDSSIPEEDYPFYSAYSYLGINTDGLRRHFIINRNPEIDYYVRLLSKIHLSIWNIINKKTTAAIPYTDLLKHSFISGKTGSGKSELMKWMFFNLQKQSQQNWDIGLVLIDPQGDLAEEVKNFHLNIDAKRLIYIDPYFKEGFTPIINPFDLADKSERNIVKTSEELVGVLEEMIEDADLSNQMRAVVTPCISTLLRKGDASLLELQKFMDDQQNKELVELGKQSPNPSHRYFFEHQFYNSAYRRTKISVFYQSAKFIEFSYVL